MHNFCVSGSARAVLATQFPAVQLQFVRGAKSIYEASAAVYKQSHDKQWVVLDTRILSRGVAAENIIAY